MSKYEKTIVQTLLDKYEKSKSFSGENKVQQKFAVKVAALFPEYADHANFEVFQAVNEAVAVLVRKRLISAKITQANVCQEVALNPAAIAEAYQHTGRRPKRDLHKAVLELLAEYRDRNGILERFAAAQAERIRLNKPLQYFTDEIQELENILRAVEALFQVERETYARDFSVRVFRDSKAFERLSAKVVNLLYEYGDFPEKEQVLENLNIVRNPTYVNCKGAGAVVISGQRIDLSSLNSDIALSAALLEDIEKIEISGHAVMTVENLTSFHTAGSKDVFMIYLGGFHNRLRREFIQKIHRQNPGAAFYHFGDIDAGGVYIFEHLRRQTGIDFQPYKMDLETLKQYQDYAKKLTENDRERLKRLKGSGFDEVINYMLAHNCKLEQEAVRF